VIHHLITRRVSDPQGKVGAGATVKLVLPGGSIVTESKTDANVQFSITRAKTNGKLLCDTLTAGGDLMDNSQQLCPETASWEASARQIG